MLLRFPGKSYRGPLPPLSEFQASLADELRASVTHLAATIGERNLGHIKQLDATADWIERTLAATGLPVERQAFDVEGHACYNLAAELPGVDRPEEIVVVGAHYDTVTDCPGANDNGSGVAAVLALARRFADRPQARTVRWLAFANEEAPYYGAPDTMGSWFYARTARERGEQIVAMLSLETIGFYSDEENSQRYPAPFGMFYPSEGNFLAFVGNIRSRTLVRDCIAAFRRRAKFPSEGAALPESIPGVSWSDHWAFWQEGYAALMVTDTAPFRYPYYHTPDDLPDQLVYDRMARVVDGLAGTIEALCGPTASSR
jgi:peptidase M28-like protein